MVGAWEAIVRKMPPLRHKVGEEYDPKTSEVFQWLLSDQKIQTKILQTLIGPDHEPRLVYNSATGTWQGVDFKNFEPAAQEEVVDL